MGWLLVRKRCVLDSRVWHFHSSSSTDNSPHKMAMCTGSEDSRPNHVLVFMVVYSRHIWLSDDIVMGYCKR